MTYIETKHKEIEQSFSRMYFSQKVISHKCITTLPEIQLNGGSYNDKWQFQYLTLSDTQFCLHSIWNY